MEDLIQVFFEKFEALKYYAPLATKKSSIAPSPSKPSSSKLHSRYVQVTVAVDHYRGSAFNILNIAFRIIILTMLIVHRVLLHGKSTFLFTRPR